MAKLFPKLPSLSELLEAPQIKRLVESAGDNSVVAGVQVFLDQVRGELQTAAEKAPDVGELADQIARWISGSREATFQPVINATGVLLSAPLGRAPLANAAVEHVASVAGGYCNLTAGGAHDIRNQAAVESALQSFVGAESAVVVNDHASAMLLAASVASGRDIIVSRGEMTAVGGCDLDVLCAQANVRGLVGVGAANGARIEAYQNAITPDTRALLRVHCASFEMVGDVAAVETSTLATLAHQRKLPLIVSLESGALIDLARYGVQLPTVPEMVASGADLVAFAGDQMLGGPHCGLLVGRRPLIAAIRRHPLFPMLQVEKMTLAALEATLRIYQDQQQLESRLPILELLSTSAANLQHRAHRLALQLKTLPLIQEVTVAEGMATLMASVPSQEIPSWHLILDLATGQADKIAQQLRMQSPAVWPIVRRQQLVLDLRAVKPAEDELLLAAVRNLAQNDPAATTQQ